VRQPIEDRRIVASRPLLPPAILLEEIPRTEAMTEFVLESREACERIIVGEDPRLLVVVGPCSIHDPESAKEYAEKLREAQERYQGSLLLVLRSYFEKPRTSVGWKGLINDPDLDGSFRINKGLRMARKLLAHYAGLGLPAAVEFLDLHTPQHTSDLVTWGAIGARTTESQTHRELASGLSMPVGFKNATDGNIQAAVDAVLAARNEHWFPSSTKDGVSAISQTQGNDTCHVILRGGSKSGPNYTAPFVEEAVLALRKKKLPERVMIDASHANSQKDHSKQKEVVQAICEQLKQGSPHLCGVMLESHLLEGKQDYLRTDSLTYGQSITDTCVSWEDTLPMLDQLAQAKS
jgi:3-deoxy-7-phosphoheptulonate synthase